MKISPFVIIALVASHALVGTATYFAGSIDKGMNDTALPFERPTTLYERVLDGDTVVIDGIAIHIRGVDAPELGPWAHCWAEAIAARQSMETLERELSAHEYKVVDRTVDKNGKVSARFIEAGKYDISNAMKVYGAGAAVDGRWDWCGTTVKLSPGMEKATSAPNIWWPSGNVYDTRAAD